MLTSFLSVVMPTETAENLLLYNSLLLALKRKGVCGFAWILL